MRCQENIRTTNLSSFPKAIGFTSDDTCSSATSIGPSRSFISGDIRSEPAGHPACAALRKFEHLSNQEKEALLGESVAVLSDHTCTVSTVVPIQQRVCNLRVLLGMAMTNLCIMNQQMVHLAQNNHALWHLLLVQSGGAASAGANQRYSILQVPRVLDTLRDQVLPAVSARLGEHDDILQTLRRRI